MNDSFQKLFAFDVFLSQGFAYSTFLFELPLELKLKASLDSTAYSLTSSAKFFRCKAKWNLKNVIRFISFGFIKFDFDFDRLHYVELSVPEQFNKIYILDGPRRKGGA